ncbi:MAG: 2-oxoacid:acceptor oxidoreductase subunit alpha [Anaerolineae bacterium]|nr:2-oxoacid:acceptor oxidoreductase subunit alpha [Anaerolineae bacterium]
MGLEITEKSENTKSEIINNFCITFSTINGSGSATANSALLRAIFKMGVPVSGKNIFPSNIQGLPTWYTIRISKDGYIARVEKDDIVVAMNRATFTRELEYILPGGVLLYPEEFSDKILREDIIQYPMPVKQLVNEAQVPSRLKDYVANMVYVGVLGQLLGIDLDKIKQALAYHFKGKQSPIDSNFNIIKMAAEWAGNNLEKRDPYYVRPMDLTNGMIMADGNTAAALGSIYGGVQFVGWYPITPASSLVEALNEYLPGLRKDPLTGKDTYAVVQAEDELAAVGMAIGAGWGGLRAMTSTSGPGLSLMAEYLGLGYYAEVPIVVWDIQRVGPSTGLPTRTAQGDLTFANFISHGDTHYILLFPGSIQECFEFGWKSFDLAERFQIPVIVLSDLDMGMNNWMSEPFQYPDTPIDRGKVLWEEDLEAILKKTNGAWGRYRDIDGDGIPYRTVPGNKHPRSAYFARGTGHDEFADYSEEQDVWERVMDRMALKYRNAKNSVPKPIVDQSTNNPHAIISFGSTEPAINEARDILKKHNLHLNYMRIRAIPFTDEILKFIEDHEKVYIVEINRDGQMMQLLTIAYPALATRFIQVSHLDGLPLTANWIVDEIKQYEAFDE